MRMLVGRFGQKPIRDGLANALPENSARVTASHVTATQLPRCAVDPGFLSNR
jgi:hypothetical protein